MSTYREPLTIDDAVHYLTKELRQLGQLAYTSADWILVNNLQIDDVDQRDAILSELASVPGVQKNDGVYILVEKLIK